MLEPDLRRNALEQRVVLAEVRQRVRAREHAELDDLRAEQRERDEREHRVDLPRAAEDVDRPAREHEHPGEPEQQQEAPGQEEEPARAVEQHEANVPPRVAEAAQLRLARPREVVDRDLARRRACGGTP